MLLDISRSIHNEDQKRKIDGLVSEIFYKKKNELLEQGCDDEQATDLALYSQKQDVNKSIRDASEE